MSNHTIIKAWQTFRTVITSVNSRPTCLFAFFIFTSETFSMEMGVTNSQNSLDRLKVVKNMNLPLGQFHFAEWTAEPKMVFPDNNVQEGLDPRSILKINLHPAKGSNINIEIWLPEAENWNGNFVGHGNGGAAGGINSAGLIWTFSQGYVAATTDMGTSPNPDSGIDNPEVWKDFGYRATHLMTTITKEIIQAYYGRGPQYSYFVGGSTGGQQAIQEAQRYPEDYDGIVAMVPAHCRTPLHAYFLWNDQILTQCPFSETQERNVIAAANEMMASRGVRQLAGKCVSDPRCTTADIEAVIALARKKDDSLTDQHAEALRKLFDGPVHAKTGERIFGGVPLGSTFNNTRGNLYLFHWVFGKDVKLNELNFDEDFDTYTNALAPYLNAENSDLKAFHARGGKLIMASGTSDSIVPYHATLDFYERVIDSFGSLDTVQSFLKFYLIPGKDHGANGSGINKHPDMLNLISQWREHDVDPGALRVQRVIDGVTEVDMPIFPYPQTTQWSENGGYEPTTGTRSGVPRVAKRFRELNKPE